MKALRRDMYNSRQTLQWDIESGWWDSMEGKRWLANQNIRDGTDFWNQFGAAYKYSTLDEMYNHWKNINETTKTIQRTT